MTDEPGGTRRHHLAQARHLAELALERRGHRRSHHLRARARIEGLNLDGWVIDLRQRRQRQETICRDPDEQDRDHDEAGRDRPVDEDPGRVHQRASGAAHCADAPGRAGGCAAQPTPAPPRLTARSVADGDGPAAPPSSSAGAAETTPRRPIRPLPPGRLGGRRCPTTVTFAPSRSRSTPSMTTLSPGGKPLRDRRQLAVGGAGDDIALGNRRIIIEEVNEIAGWPNLYSGVGRERDALQACRQADGR